MKTIQQTEDYDLDNALMNWDNLNWVIQKTEITKKRKYLIGLEWYRCVICHKYIQDGYGEHLEYCAENGIFHIKPIGKIQVR